MRVSTELVVETLVSSLHTAAEERAQGAGVSWLEDMGYQARALELERFAPAREPMPWLTEMLATREPEALCAQLAGDEPLDRPDPGQAPSWRVPGPGGHVRHYVAVRAARAFRLADGGDVDDLALKRAWMRGFFRHCCEEAQA